MDNESYWTGYVDAEKKAAEAKAAFFQYIYTPEREASRARIAELEAMVAELNDIRDRLERQMKSAARLHAERECPIIDDTDEGGAA